MTQFGGYIMLGIYVRTSKDDTENSIGQQKKMGIAFAKNNNMEFEVYGDEGKSGYTIADDEDLFKNRPGFTKLMRDIKEEKIDSVWVWEHSRLSRNQYGSAVIFREFEKRGVRVYVKDALYDLKDKNAKLMRGILDAMAEYEREMIVSRTTRGTHDRIDRGERSFGKLYGYRKVGVDAKGYQIVEKADSEIENIKYGYKRILEGATLRQLTLELYEGKSFDKTEALRVSRHWHKILCHFSYTGYELNTAGLAIRKKFDNFETDSLSELNDGKYYTRSAHYREKLVSVGKWIKAVERLRINRKIHRESGSRRASKDLGTGILTCSECGQKYYSYMHENRKGEKTYRYNYYKHYMAMNRKIQDCHQKKSVIGRNVNEILKIFYFFNSIMFDRTKERNEETLRLIKQERLEMKEEIKKCEKEITQYGKNIGKFNRALDETMEVETIKVLAKRISGDEEKKTKANERLVELQIALEKLNIKYAGTELENMYYNVKDRIGQFFKKMKVEEQRDELLRVIKKCEITEGRIIIDSGGDIFVFNTEDRYEFDEGLLKKLDDDKYFKINYTGQTTKFEEALAEGKKELAKDIVMTEENIRYFGKVVMRPIFLGSVEFDMKGYVREIFRENYIEYNLEGKTNVIFFDVQE
jgi:DNA invertase Pin-like site-specific DNA recombinase